MGELVAAGENGAAMEVVEAVEAVQGLGEAPDGRAAAQLEKGVRLLDEIMAVWRARALGGGPEAAEEGRELQEQRLVLVQLWPEGQRAVKVSGGAAEREGE